MHFPNGELIRTTPEHPFFYEGCSGGGYGRLEAIWAQALTRNRNVSNVSVTLNYGANDVRPDSFDIKFTI